MTTTLEQSVSQIQQELLTIRAQVASRGRTSESVQATDNLTTAQSHEDVHSKASSCINTNDVGRPNEFSGKEEDLQHWSDDIKAFFAGVLKESKMMLDWTADQTMEITTTAIDLEFLPTESNGGSRSTQPGVRLEAYALDAQESHESRSKRHCCQLAEEPAGGVATAT